MAEETMVRIVAASTSEGRPSWETLLVEGQDDGTFVLLRTPCIALGLASGDRFEVDDSGGFHVLQRAGNLTLQIYFPTKISNQDLQILSATAKRLHGVMDAHTDRVVAMSVPVKSGFDKVEGALNEALRNLTGAEWIYGNVYDATGKPLNWW